MCSHNIYLYGEIRKIPNLLDEKKKVLFGAMVNDCQRLHIAYLVFLIVNKIIDSNIIFLVKIIVA